MNIESLKILLYIVEQGSISKVAEQINLSQSAVSQQMKALEQALGVQLLERSPKGVTVTESGKLVCRHARAITGSYDQMRHEINDFQNQNRTLRITSTPIVYSYALPCTLYHVKNNYPSYTLEMESASSKIAEEKVLQGAADIGFIVGKPTSKALTAKRVFSDRVFLVAGNETDIPNEISCHDLYSYPLLMLSKTQRTRQALDRYLRSIGVNLGNLQILYDLDSTESIKLSAVRGYGMAFLPYMAIKKELYNKQLRMIKIDCFDLENHYYAIRRQQSDHLDAELLKLITYIEKILKDTIC